jgi:single-strand DNA-binding protein
MKNVTILGNVGKTPETREAGSGTVTGFSMAVSDGWGDKKTTIWFDVSVWGKRGEVIANNVNKGDKLCVTGDLSTREYNGKTYLTVNASDFSFVGARSAPQEAPSVPDIHDNDEIPF